MIGLGRIIQLKRSAGSFAFVTCERPGVGHSEVLLPDEVASKLKLGDVLSVVIGAPPPKPYVKAENE